MRPTAVIAGVALCTVFITATTTQAQAAEAPTLTLNSSTALVSDLTILDHYQDQEIEETITEQTEPATAPQPPEHTVAAGENLTEIAEKYQSTWERIFAKNTDLEHPDIIKAGDILIIPLADEELTEREVPVLEPVVEPSPSRADSSRTRSVGSTYSTARGSSAGNRYIRGYCTWYAKNRRPDLPNNLGNANTWVSRARAQGIATGSTPAVGAIGQQGMHVVYVESVNGDGTVTISEMNYKGHGIISSRTVPASTFQYIY